MFYKGGTFNKEGGEIRKPRTRLLGETSKPYNHTFYHVLVFSGTGREFLSRVGNLASRAAGLPITCHFLGDRKYVYEVGALTRITKYARFRKFVIATA